MSVQHLRGELRGNHVATILARIHVTAGGCWEYTGVIIPSGYGQVGRNRLTHRVMWEALNGAIPEGFDIDHLCKNRVCCNPDHLEAVTRAENLRRAEDCLSTVNAAKTHCAHGHEFTSENTYQRPDRPGRICRACRDAWLVRFRVANRDRIAKQARAYRLRKKATA